MTRLAMLDWVTIRETINRKAEWREKIVIKLSYLTSALGYQSLVDKLFSKTFDRDRVMSTYLSRKANSTI